MAWWDRFARRRGRHEAPAERANLSGFGAWFTTFPATPGAESIGTSFHTYAESGYAGNGVVLENSSVTWPSHSGSSGVTLTMIPQRA